MKENEKILLELVRMGWHNDAVSSLPSSISWQDVMATAEPQGMLAIAFDGIQKIPREQMPPMELLMDWLGQTSYYEQIYENHRQTIASLAKFYNDNGLCMILLKGYGLSLNYPVPNHRPVGDIDILMSNIKPNHNHSERSKRSEMLYQYADQMIHDKLGIEVDNGHHHSVFHYQGVMVENYYDFINVHSHRSNVENELLFKKLAEEGAREHEVDGVKILLPSDILNILFVCRHNACHFASEKITLRMLLDFALLAKSVSKAVGEFTKPFDWNRFWQLVEWMGMRDFVWVQNAICVEYFGFDKEIFHTPSRYCLWASDNKTLVERMMRDIFEPEDTGEEKKGINYLYHRSCLWWTNRWKHKMMYSDSLFSTLVDQVKSHLMKPSTIFFV